MTPSQPRGIFCRQKQWTMHKERPQMSPFSSLHAKTDFVVLQLLLFIVYYVIFFTLAALRILSMVQDQTFLRK